MHLMLDCNERDAIPREAAGRVGAGRSTGEGEKREETVRMWEMDLSPPPASYSS